MPVGGGVEVGAGPGQWPQHRGQLRPNRPSEVELTLVAAVLGRSELEEPPVLVELVIRQGAVGVDPVDDPVGQLLQVLRAERRRLLGEKGFRGVNLSRVEPATVDLVEGPLDHRHLLRTHLPRPLRDRQHGPSWRQIVTEHRDSVADRRCGLHPAGCFPGRDPQRVGQHGGQPTLPEPFSQASCLGLPDRLVVDERHPVPLDLEPLEEADQFVVVVVVQAAVIDSGNELVQAGPELGEGVVDRRCRSEQPRGHAFILLEQVFDSKVFLSPRRWSHHPSWDSVCRRRPDHRGGPARALVTCVPATRSCSARPEPVVTLTHTAANQG